MTNAELIALLEKRPAESRVVFKDDLCHLHHIAAVAWPEGADDPVFLLETERP